MSAIAYLAPVAPDAGKAIELLTDRLLADEHWCLNAMADDSMERAFNNTALLLADPCEYGQQVKVALEALAAERAAAYIEANPYDDVLSCALTRYDGRGYYHSLI